MKVWNGNKEQENEHSLNALVHRPVIGVFASDKLSSVTEIWIHKPRLQYARLSPP